MVSPSDPWAVEEPAFLMAAAMPLSSNGLYEGSRRWWRWKSLMSLLMARSCWAEQAVNYLLKARAITFRLDWGFPSKAIEIYWGTRPLAAQLALEGPVVLGIGSAVGGFQQRPSLVLCFLADVPLDVPIQQIDGSVERVISAALVSLRDEGSYNIGERAVVVPSITTGYVSSIVDENTPEETFYPAE